MAIVKPVSCSTFGGSLPAVGQEANFIALPLPMGEGWGEGGSRLRLTKTGIQKLRNRTRR